CARLLPPRRAGRRCCQRPHVCVTSFFSSVIRPPPGSTLFPYTTLFRSGVSMSSSSGGSIGLGVVTTSAPSTGTLPRASSAKRAGDRKSTRLNSSHVKISYAVFCLKKKKHASELHVFRRRVAQDARALAG